MVEGVAHPVLDDADRFHAGQAILGLADEFRLAQENRQHGAAGSHDVVGGDDGGALVADEVGVGLEAAQEHAPQSGLVAAAFGRRDRVAIGADETVPGKPGDRPFHRAMAALAGGLPGEDLAAHERLAGERLREIVPEPPGKSEDRLLRRFAFLRDQCGRA